MADLDVLFRLTRAWLEARDIVGYHGTRLDPAQRAAIGREGLRPLDPAQREAVLRRFLGAHPRWLETESRLPEAIDFVAKGGAGNRAGQVHLTLSGAGMLRGFNHYLVEGAEFDRHVAHYLLGEETHDLNRARGQGLLCRVRVSGAAALAAANPFGEMAQPNLLTELLQTLAWSIATGQDDTKAIELDCGMIFYAGIPASAIIEVSEISDDDLWRHYDHRLR